jgi:predicted 2-oxoglutarate/Fe(II)-dependent dioxygenase YbiX
VSVYIFLGPTLPQREAREELDAIYLPPAAQGDVYRAAAARADVIGIVDGYFERVPAVWHKEILWAMVQGTHVYGGASMGAIRAAELGAFGMTGVGKVYEAFRHGVLEDDDEVAVVHGPPETGFKPLSDALVNVRLTMTAAADAGVVSRCTAVALIELAKSRFYADRTYANLLRDANAARLPSAEVAALHDWLPNGKIDCKRLDALEMLRRIRLDLCAERGPKQVSFWFEYTYHWDRCWRMAATRGADRPDTTPFADVREELCLAVNGWQRAHAGGLMRLLADRESRQHGIQVTPRQIEATAAAFRRARGLHDPADVKHWLRGNDLLPDQFIRLLEHEARVARVAHLFHPELPAMIADYLRCTGEYASLAERARDKRRVLARRGFDHVQPDTVGLTNDELLGWYFRQRLGMSMPTDVDLQAHALGFTDAAELRHAVFREWLYVRATKGQIEFANRRSASADSSCSRPAPGDPAPAFTLRSAHLGPISLDRLSGKPTLLVFPESLLSTDELKGMARIGDEHDMHIVCIVPRPSECATPTRGQLLLLGDEHAVVRRRYGISASGAVLLSAAHRLLGVFSGAAPRALAAQVRPLLAARASEEADLHAPILLIPDVLDRDLCGALIEHWHGGDTTPFQVPGASTDGAQLVTRRVDHWLRPGTLTATVEELIVRRVLPELHRAFYFHPEAVEQYRIGCYPAAAGRSFPPHRDNTSAETDTRRYSMSINLNEEYVGGNLRFPEYGAREYRGRPGWAMLFSSSLVHEVTSVASGVRFALISHFRGGISQTELKPGWPENSADSRLP